MANGLTALRVFYCAEKAGIYIRFSSAPRAHLSGFCFEPDSGL